MSDNPFMKRLKPKDKGVHGRKAERNLSKRLGMDLQPGSGAMDSAKGDLKGITFLLESKATSADSISIPRTWLSKIKFEARDQNKEAALAVNFVTGDGQPQQYGSWVMIEEKLFKELMQYADKQT